MKLRSILAPLVLLGALSDSACAPDPPAESPPPSVQAEATSEPTSSGVPDAPPDAHIFKVNQKVEVASVPPNFQWSTNPPPPEGMRRLEIEISTFERIGDAELPTVRRVGVLITGLDNEGKPTIVDQQSWLYSDHIRTPNYIDLDVGPGVAIAVLQVSLFGWHYEVVEAFVTTPGQTEGLHAEAKVDPIEGSQRGIVILNLPIALA